MIMARNDYIKRKYFLVTIPILFLLLIFMGKAYEGTIGHKYYSTFNETDIIGKIQEVGIRHHGAFFKVGSNNREFVFYPYTNPILNDEQIFNYFASPGDSVFKAAYSDTLYLFKNGKEYKYTFQKFE